MPYSDKTKNKSYHKQYRLDHKEEWKDYHKQYSKKWYINNKQDILQKHKIYRNTHRSESKLNRDLIRLNVLNHYSNYKLKCNNCGEDHIEFLEIDHINGNGRQHKKSLHLYGNALYRWLIKNNYPDGFQVLCSNCNIKKVRLQSKNKILYGSPQQKSTYKYQQNLKLNILSHYTINGKIKCSCPNCNITDIDVLCLDHINNDGSDHRKLIGAASMYRWIRDNNYPDIMRVLCHNCNQSLGNYGYCPHTITGDSRSPPPSANSV